MRTMASSLPQSLSWDCSLSIRSTWRASRTHSLWRIW